jgi:hypothetical protein
MSTTVNIDGIGKLTRVTAPFNEAIETLEKAGAKKIVSFRDLALARLQKGKNHLVFKIDSFSSEAVVYTADNTTYFLRNSPLLDIPLANKAAPAYRELEDLNDNHDPLHLIGTGEIYFGKCIEMAYFEQMVKNAEEDLSKPVEERRVFIHKGNSVFVIPTNTFAENELTRWLYGSATLAEQYGEFLFKQRIFSCMGWLVDWLDPDASRPPFIRQLVMNGSKGDINGGRRFGWDDGHMGGTWGVF